MRITISARHCEVTDGLRERAQAVAERLAELSPHALDATVVFDATPQRQTVELRLHARGRKLLIGIGQGGDHRSALDRAEEKLRAQLTKTAKLRQRSRHAAPRSRARST
ncbi:MAG TPA: HPF/RaiA family ribosome-associated protein [Gemmatimonadales bacterium]|nr:HPF/RaiA family ribosome-associated protein [Gemmatimonadales bacterium]